jgi:hypothetical protein
VSFSDTPNERGRRRTQRTVLSVYVGAFAIATACHVLDIARGGWLPYRAHALGLNVFWTALTALDPLAILLLIYRRRAGVCLALLIISVDVAVNLVVGLREFIQSGRFTFWGLYTQIPVGVFMWVTAPLVWATAPGDSLAPAQPRPAANG